MDGSDDDSPEEFDGADDGEVSESADDADGAPDGAGVGPGRSAAGGGSGQPLGVPPADVRELDALVAWLQSGGSLAQLRSGDPSGGGVPAHDGGQPSADERSRFARYANRLRQRARLCALSEEVCGRIDRELGAAWDWDLSQCCFCHGCARYNGRHTALYLYREKLVRAWWADDAALDVLLRDARGHHC